MPPRTISVIGINFDKKSKIVEADFCNVPSRMQFKLEIPECDMVSDPVKAVDVPFY